MAYTAEDYAILIKEVEKSKCPCEQETFHQNNCTDNAISDDTRDAKAEQDCLCSSNFLEMKRACFECHKVHGSDSLEMDFAKAVVLALQTSFCSATEPVLFLDAFTSTKNVSYTGSSTGANMMKSVCTSYHKDVSRAPNGHDQRTEIANFHTGSV